MSPSATSPHFLYISRGSDSTTSLCQCTTTPSEQEFQRSRISNLKGKNSFPLGPSLHRASKEFILRLPLPKYIASAVQDSKNGPASLKIGEKHRASLIPKEFEIFWGDCCWRNKILTTYSVNKPSGLMGLLLIAISPCCPGGRILLSLSTT